MKKPWSISTTVRNPDRIREFLKVLKLLEGNIWNRGLQRKFQIMLIQNKIYGYGSQQFYNDLSEKYLSLMNNQEKIKFSEAEKILDSKKYVGGGDMRGRQSFKPLEKMGLVFLDEKNRVRISAVGNIFLKEDYDIGEVFFKSFIKWQLPNLDSRDFRKEDGFNIKPFISTLHLIFEVNEIWSKLNNDPVGISKKEFSLFVPTLINYKDIKKIAKEIVNLRIKLKKVKKGKKKFFENYGKKFMSNFLRNTENKIVDSKLRNAKEYTDNIIRYFRLTRYIYIRGNGYYVDLEPRRRIEIKGLLVMDSGKAIDFKDRKEYTEYLSDINKPILIWETKEKLTEIILIIIKEIKLLENKISISKFKEKLYKNYNISESKLYIEELREERRHLQDRINLEASQEIKNIKKYVEILRERIYGMDERPIVLEKYVALGLNALDDALRISPNYPVGDDNEPTSTAPSGKPDIECFYEDYNSICEVTMLRDRSQWFNEGQPVMRHLRNFEEENNKKENYCLFIAPNLHVDTVETFWMSINHGYRGKKQKIVPLSLKQFVELLEILIKIKESGKKFTHKNLFDLYKEILNLKKVSNSEEWIKIIPLKINNWKKALIS